MTQILIHRSTQGIVLATDSRAVAFSDQGGTESKPLTVCKVFHPLPNVVLVTGGAGYGQWLCENFARYLAEHGLDDVVLAAGAALPLLRSLLDALKKQCPTSLDFPHLDRFYVAVAGIHRSGSDPPSVDIHLFASEGAFNPLHEVTLERVITIPRQVTLEYRLTRPGAEALDMDAVEAMFEGFLCNAVELDEDIGPPFHFLRIQPTGVHWRTSEGGATVEGSLDTRCDSHDG